MKIAVIVRGRNEPEWFWNRSDAQDWAKKHGFELKHYQGMDRDSYYAVPRNRSSRDPGRKHLGYDVGPTPSGRVYRYKSAKDAVRAAQAMADNMGKTVYVRHAERGVEYEKAFVYKKVKPSQKRAEKRHHQWKAEYRRRNGPSREDLIASLKACRASLWRAKHGRKKKRSTRKK